MAIKETRNSPKELIEAVPEEVDKLAREVAGSEEELEDISDQAKEELERTEERKEEFRAMLNSWNPKTKLGKLVKEGKEKDIDKILNNEKKILEPEIIDSLIRVETDLLSIGQAKGKFGGGKRRAWRQTQKKTMEGNVVTFSCMAVVGDRNGHIGLGMGKAKETLPAREKAIRHAKLNVIKVIRGFESPENEKDFHDPHTVPFKIEGKCGSVRLKLLPAPRGTGLVVSDECKKILRLAGIKDVYAVSGGYTRTTFNLAKACVDALSKTNKLKL